MGTSAESISDRQRLYIDLVLGILLYSVVLGFFNDYTDWLFIDSYSTLFAAAVVLQILTYLTILLKRSVMNWFKQRPGQLNQIAQWVGAWLILFSSKFVFLWVIDLVFGSAVSIPSFIGLMLMIITLTIGQKLLELGYAKLA